MNIITVPGIWSRGEGSTDKLTAPLEARGHTVYELNQKIRSPWDVRFKKNREADAAEIVAYAKEVDADAIAAHSYGSLKASLAMRDYHFRAAYLFRPAMPRKWEFPIDTRVTCIHSKQDWAVLFGGLLRFDHPFGMAGRKGFKSQQSNVTNARSTGGHNADFTESMAECWSWYIDNDLKKV